VRITNYEFRLSLHYSLDKSQTVCLKADLEELELAKRKGKTIRVTKLRYVNGNHNKLRLPKLIWLNFSFLTEWAPIYVNGMMCPNQEIIKGSTWAGYQSRRSIPWNPPHHWQQTRKHPCCKGWLHKSRLSVSHHEYPLIGSEVETWRTHQVWLISLIPPASKLNPGSGIRHIEKRN